MNKGLLVIDVQKDFCEQGRLPARDTTSLLPTLNHVIEFSIQRSLLCVFVRDWHPPNHCSFDTMGGPWPVHCVQSTRGAEFADGLLLPQSKLVIDIEKDRLQMNMSYSAFENTDLEEQLRERLVDEVAICGIATEYCVRAAALDAVKLGFHTLVLTDLIRPIEKRAGGAQQALKEMTQAGVSLSTSVDWMATG